MIRERFGRRDVTVRRMIGGHSGNAGPPFAGSWARVPRKAGSRHSPIRGKSFVDPRLAPRRQARGLHVPSFLEYLVCTAHSECTSPSAGDGDFFKEAFMSKATCRAIVAFLAFPACALAAEPVTFSWSSSNTDLVTTPDAIQQSAAGVVVSARG